MRNFLDLLTKTVAGVGALVVPFEVAAVARVVGPIKALCSADTYYILN